jgi:hypothetical protein
MVNGVPPRGPAAANDNNAPSPDFRITYSGVIATLDLLTKAAQQWWLAELCDEIEARQWLGRCSIDPRIAEDVREVLTEAGFVDAEAS